MNVDFENFNKNIYYKVSEFILDSIIKLASINEHYADEDIKILMPYWLEELIKKTVLSEVENLDNKGVFTFYGHDVYPNYENKLIVYSIKFNKDEPKQFFELDLKSLFNE